MTINFHQTTRRVKEIVNLSICSTWKKRQCQSNSGRSLGIEDIKWDTPDYMQKKMEHTRRYKRTFWMQLQSNVCARIKIVASFCWALFNFVFTQKKRNQFKKTFVFGPKKITVCAYKRKDNVVLVMLYDFDYFLFPSLFRLILVFSRIWYWNWW